MARPPPSTTCAPGPSPRPTSASASPKRGLPAPRGERLALIRVEGARWSIEEIDEQDRLVRVTMFAEDDLDGAMARFGGPSEGQDPTSAERWQRDLTAMINERRLDTLPGAPCGRLHR